jgi:hypothetical protein
MSLATIRWPTALLAGGIAGVLAAALVTSSIGAALGMISTGVLCVLVYRRLTPSHAITSVIGAKLGALSGLLELPILTAAICVQTWVFHNAGGVRAAILHGLGRTAQFADPEIEPQLIERLGPAGLGAFIIVLLIGLLTCAAFGGAVIGMIYGRKARI